MSLKRILFLLGDIPQEKTNGQILYQYLIIKNISIKYDCYVAGYYNGKTFLDDLLSLENKIFKLKKNSKSTGKMKAVLTLSPLISCQIHNNDNINYINDIINIYSIDVLHCIYFPSTCLLSREVIVNKKIMTMPDSYSKYYKQIRTKNIKYFYNYISYIFLEKKLKNTYDSVQFVNQNEATTSKFKNALYSPLLLNDFDHLSPNKKIRKVLLPRSNKNNILWFIENITSKLKEYDFVIISSDKLIIDYTKHDNIEIITWVENYDAYVAQFLLHIVIDHVGTGLSTKVMHAFALRNLIIGTKLSYRGLPNLPDTLKIEFNSADQLINHIKYLMSISKNEYSDIINEAKNYIVEKFNNERTIQIIQDSYD